jgi:CheY-like chemotaxis protein
MCTSQQEGILVVDDNPVVRETLAEWLRAGGYEVATASTGERAFLMLRDERRWVGWLYTRADLPGLIDGAILADEYRDRFPGRPVVIAAADDRPPSARDVVLKQPAPAALLEAIRTVVDGTGLGTPRHAAAAEHRRAA